MDSEKHDESFYRRHFAKIWYLTGLAVSGAYFYKATQESNPDGVSTTVIAVIGIPLLAIPLGMVSFVIATIMWLICVSVRDANTEKNLSFLWFAAFLALGLFAFLAGSFVIPA